MTQTIAFQADRLDVLMPMHVLISKQGIILHAGPTLQKAHPDQTLVGEAFFDIFDMRRPGGVADIGEVCRTAGTKCSLRMRDADRTPVIGNAICLAEPDGVLMNLSFGIAVVDAVGRFGLAGSDFAATDLTLELLYLVEANAAAMEQASMTGVRLAGAKDAAKAEALTDPLTGLENRRGLEQALDRLILRGTPFALVNIDLDFFKAVNDTLGHAAGDLVLQSVAGILGEITRSGDVVARVGGDEFVLVFLEVTDERKLGNLAARLIARMEEPVPYGDSEARISASIGITSTANYDRPDLERMERDADDAVYASKGRGRACYTLARKADGDRVELAAGPPRTGVRVATGAETREASSPPR